MDSHPLVSQLEADLLKEQIKESSEIEVISVERTSVVYDESSDNGVQVTFDVHTMLGGSLQIVQPIPLKKNMGRIDIHMHSIGAIAKDTLRQRFEKMAETLRHDLQRHGHP